MKREVLETHSIFQQHDGFIAQSMFVYCKVVVYCIAWKFQGTERMGISRFLNRSHNFSLLNLVGLRILHCGTGYLQSFLSTSFSLPLNGESCLPPTILYPLTSDRDGEGGPVYPLRLRDYIILIGDDDIVGSLKGAGEVGVSEDKASGGHQVWSIGRLDLVPFPAGC